jgi:hypothetical protein
MVANNDVKQDYPGFFALDPIGRAAKWRTAMLADPSHILGKSKSRAIAVERGLFLAGENCRSKNAPAGYRNEGF